MSRLALERIPHARLAILAEAGHSPFLEQPKAFNALLADFAASARE
jgi:pimeloyl-ACP methyl ester carboxylesterase